MCLISFKILIAFLNIQIQPPAFGQTSGRNSPPLFEALYPRVEGPSDTRHFVERADEDPTLFDIKPVSVHVNEFTEF